MSQKSETRFDGARLAIIANRFDGVARKMSNTLLRTGRSGVINRAKDFSCCIVTAACDLLTPAESLPIHVLSGPDIMARSMTTFHPTLKRGDAFIHNSAYHGCSHAADQTILTPVIDDAGVHRFTVVAKAHQADIGNSVPTTYMGDARDVYHEGALIFPCVAIQRDYQDLDDILRMCEMRIRVPEQWRGDYLAALGAARIGERELLSLGAELGWETLENFTTAWFDYSESRMVRAIAALPSGEASAVSIHDAFPGTPEAGVPIRSIIKVDAEAGQIEVDLTDNPDCLPCGLNLSEACARTSALVGVFNSIDPSVPKNAGAFRRVTVHLRENCIAGIPRHPASCSTATTNIADRVANATQRAFAELADGIGMAEVGALIPPAGGVASGRDPRTGLDYVNQLVLAFSGGAGGPHGDAWLTIAHVGNGGLAWYGWRGARRALSSTACRKPRTRSRYRGGWTACWGARDPSDFWSRGRGHGNRLWVRRSSQSGGRCARWDGRRAYRSKNPAPQWDGRAACPPRSGTRVGRRDHRVDRRGRGRLRAAKRAEPRGGRRGRA